MFESMLIPMLTAEQLHLVMYFSTEYHYSKQNIIILFWKYFVDIRSKDGLNDFWEYKKGKLFAVHVHIIFTGIWYCIGYRQTSIPVVIPVIGILPHSLPLKGHSNGMGSILRG
jgi:hypothetical protein